MATRPIIIAAAFFLAPLPLLRAGDVAPADGLGTNVSDTAPEPSKLKTSYELDADTSFVGDASTHFGDGMHGDVSEERTRAHYIVAPQYNDGPIYRFGLAYQRYSFGFSRAAAIPDTLQAENLIVGIDFELFNSWLVRVEADPGIYSDTRVVGFRGFNVPFLIGGSYIVNADLQWVVGIDVDVNRQIPIFPAVGFRWNFADQWVLDMVLPTPRLEYQWSKNLNLYVGLDVDDGTYRVDRGIGNGLDSSRSRVVKSEVTTSKLIGYQIRPFHRPTPIYSKTTKEVTNTVPGDSYANLSGAVVEYDELRVGAGLSWKPFNGVTLELEGGYLPYREFDFHRADSQFLNSGGAPYGQMSFNAQF